MKCWPFSLLGISDSGIASDSSGSMVVLRYSSSGNAVVLMEASFSTSSLKGNDKSNVLIAESFHKDF